MPAALAAFVLYWVVKVYGPEWVKRVRKTMVEPPPPGYASRRALPWLGRMAWLVLSPIVAMALVLGLGVLIYQGMDLVPFPWNVAAVVLLLVLLSAESWYPWLRGRR
jgi:hypothetical protein